MDRFAMLLADLGSLINVPLHPDAKRACKLNIDGKLHIQLEEQESKERILIAAFLIEVPPGRFREILFKETLKENNAFPRLGTFGYVPRNNMLALFSYVYYPGLSGDKLADFLEVFIEKAFSWKAGVETGQLPQRGQTGHKGGPSVFDLQRQKP